MSATKTTLCLQALERNIARSEIDIHWLVPRLELIDLVVIHIESGHLIVESMDQSANILRQNRRGVLPQEPYNEQWFRAVDRELELSVHAPSKSIPFWVLNLNIAKTREDSNDHKKTSLHLSWNPLDHQMSRPPISKDHLRSWSDIESIATSKGIRFQILSDQDLRGNTLRADPDILYVCKPSSLFPNSKRDSCDTCILWNGGTARIRMADLSRQAFRKLLDQEPGPIECSICLEDTHRLRRSSCPLCESTCCWVCNFKLILENEDINDTLHCWRTRPDCKCIHNVSKRCCECRQVSGIDVLKYYVRVIDTGYLDKFNPDQQRHLLMIKRCDPEYRTKTDVWKEQLREFQVDMSTRFKNGKTIKLRALKKKEWNRRTAKIVGKRTLRNGVFRWPIKLRGEKQPVMIKQCNLQKMQSTLWVCDGSII